MGHGELGRDLSLSAQHDTIKRGCRTLAKSNLLHNSRPRDDFPARLCDSSPAQKSEDGE